MNHTQNEKIMQIGVDTLVVGIDIGKNTHYARAFDYRGVELGKLLIFENAAQGYQSLDDWMERISADHRMTKALVGFEPTGHYWFTLGDHLKRKGHQLGIVNPYHVKCFRELDDNNPTKNDRKDPKTIALLLKDGRYRDVYIPEDVYLELREVVDQRELLTEQMSGVSNRVTRWLDIRFPEFGGVFKNWTKKAARATLWQFGTPERVLEAGANGLCDAWSTVMERVTRTKAVQLVDAAAVSIGRKDGERAALRTLQNLLAQYELLETQREGVDQLIKELLMQVPHAEKFVAVPGVGYTTAAAIVSEIGDIRRFSDPRQILKYAGLNLRENSSGEHKGQTTITKRGRRRLREALFRVAVAMCANNAEFKALHRHNLSRETNPLTKMQSVIALAGKLIRVAFAILTKGVEYDGEKLLSDVEKARHAA